MLISGCGKEKEIIRYKPQPGPVTLIYPPADTFITVNNPTFTWHRLTDAVHYQLQAALAADFISKSVDVQISETTYTVASNFPNGTHFWRVRGDNLDGEWGDWSDAEIRILYKSDYVNYFELLSQTDTYGIPQDLFVRNDTAFVADGQADLTLMDVSNPLNPTLMYNIEPGQGDFGKAIYINPVDTFPYVFLADMDGRVKALNLQDTSRMNDLSFGSQNVEDIDGFFKFDTLWVASVSSLSQRRLLFTQLQYAPLLVDVSGLTPDFELPADGMGVCVDSTANHVFVASATAGLKIYDISDIYNPSAVSTVLLSGTCLEVDLKDGYAYVAGDWDGLFVVDVRNPNSPVQVEQINTSGRTKDVHVLGGYAFIADGSGGLKAIDISVPDSAHFVANYPTSYAYGVYATSEYIYVCDRGNGLMIFENRTSQ
jgi:hypothetical protein